MMSILSILVFMLVQRHVVCDGELFPVSMFEVDSGEHQPIDPQKKDEVGALQVRNAAERSLVPTTDFIKQEIKWMKTHIVDEYKFKKHPQDATWTFQPTFQDALKTAEFKAAAKRAENFFLKFALAGSEPWKLLQKTVKKPEEILDVTAARYLLVTDILRRASGGKLIACKGKRDRYTDIPLSWEIPKGGVCFPKPYGSATYKSDYDVGLIGRDSGTVTQQFNNYFQNRFGMPSELVFDTNVYAFTLEFAMPSMFPSLTSSFIFSLHQREKKSLYKMQELASAYYKVFKYNNTFFEEMKNGALKKIRDKRAMKKLQYWLDKFKFMDEQAGGALRKTKEKSQAAFRLAHNNKYQEIVAEVSQHGGYEPDMIDNVVKALLYAAEAYHTRGAIRHVVQGTQMKAINMGVFNTPLSTYDLWVSMIENWGDANKEYQHCGNVSVAECLMKMSKYLSRMFNAMRLVRARIPIRSRWALLAFGTPDDPEAAALLWRRKRKVQTVKPTSFYMFLKKFHCKGMVNKRAKAPAADQRLSLDCMTNINTEVNAYNKKLAALVTDKYGIGM